MHGIPTYNINEYMLNSQIRNRIDAVWNTFWTGGVTNPISVIEQISYLLFIRRLDDIQKRLDRQQQLGKAVINIFNEDEQELRWSKFKERDPALMLEVVRDQVFPKIKTIGGEQGSFARHMKDAIFMIPRADILDQVVQMIDSIDMKDSDTKGDLYEYLLSKLSTSGVNGQFRTPRHIIRMMVQLMKPTLSDSICDPASGTCGFLMAAEEYITDAYKAELTQKDNLEHYNNGMFTAFDFDQHMLRIGAMNMMLHGIENPRVEYRDSLSDDGENNIRDAYSLILANPPFKGSVNYDAIAPDLLKALGKTPKKAVASGGSGDDRKKKQPTEKSELLFIALILRMLKAGGRAAVIVPDGVLFGSTKSHKKIRESLVEDQMLEAVISMPSGVFKPYAGVSTAILIFTKTNSGGTGKVWFYDMQADGYSLDDKRTPLAKDGEPASHQQNNLPDIVARFADLDNEESRTRTEQSFMVDKADIVAQCYDLSINRYKETVYEEVQYDSPKVIIDRIKTLQQAMTDGVAELEALL